MLIYCISHLGEENPDQILHLIRVLDLSDIQGKY